MDESLYEILHPFFTKAVSNADRSRWNVVVELYIECFGMHLVCDEFGMQCTWYAMHCILSLLYVGRSSEWLHSSVTFIIHALPMLFQHCIEVTFVKRSSDTEEP